MIVDATTLYFGGDAVIRALPKRGGSITTLFTEDPAERSSTEGMAVDERYVYFSESGARRISRVPKAGGAREILTDDADYPREIAVDATYLYAAYNGSGEPPSGAIVRMPKGGGAVEVLAAQQHFPGSIALDETSVYFDNAATDYQRGTDGTINRVAKTGGPVQTLATTVYGTAWHMVIAQGAIFYVDMRTNSLARVPLAGGEPSIVGGSALERPLETDGNSLFGFSLPVGSTQATAVRLDPNAQSSATLAEWTVAYAKTTDVYPGAEWSYAAVASTSDADRVYWADFDSNSTERAFTIRSTSH
jgi:hypothetical protein